MHRPPSHSEHSPQARTHVSTLAGMLCILAGLLQMLWTQHAGQTPPLDSHAGNYLGSLSHAHNQAHSVWRELCLLSTQKLQQGQWWRLLSFCAAHAGFWHWAGGSLAFYIVSRSVEPIIGSLHLVTVLTLGSVSAGIAHCLVHLWGWQTAGHPEVLPSQEPLLGMLPALFTLIGVYGTILPGWRLGAASRWRVARWLAKRLRSPRALHAAWCAAVCATLWWVSGWHPELGSFALLPALLAGWTYTRMLGFGDRFFLQRIMAEGDHLERRMAQMDWEEFLTVELNPVLEKIARHGLRSLNAAERRILRHSRRKLEGW
jgi:membrane associated rhomboid family serine protease